MRLLSFDGHMLNAPDRVQAHFAAKDVHVRDGEKSQLDDDGIAGFAAKPVEPL